MDSAKLLTIAQTAELLNCSQGFVRKRIALTEANQDGGWPKKIFVNSILTIPNLNFENLKDNFDNP